MKNPITFRRLGQLTTTIALLVPSLVAYADAAADHSHQGMPPLQFAVSVLSISAGLYCLRKARVYQLKVLEGRDGPL